MGNFLSLLTSRDSIARIGTNMQEDANKQLITIAQASMMLGVSQDTINRMRRRGELSTVRIPSFRYPRLLLAEVLSIIQQRGK